MTDPAEQLEEDCRRYALSMKVYRDLAKAVLEHEVTCHQPGCVCCELDRAARAVLDTAKIRA